MRYLNKLIITSLIVCVAVLASCSQEVDPTRQDDQDVLITIGAGTRADAPDKSDYSCIGTLRVLGYKTSNGVLAFNELVVDGNPLSTNTKYEDKIKVKKGEFTFVFIANEHTDATLEAELADNNKVYTIHDFKGLSFDESAFSASSQYIPMISFKENVNVKGDNELEYENETFTETNVWPVELKRLGVKVRLHLVVPENDPLVYMKSGTIYEPIDYYYNNVPTQVFLGDKTDNSAFLKNDYTYTTSPFWGFLIKRDDITTLPNKDTYPVEALIPANHYCYGSNTIDVSNVVILPESYFTPLTNKDKGVELVVHDGSGAKSRKGRIFIDTGYALPRNTFIDVVAKVEDAGLKFNYTVTDWDDTTDPYDKELGEDDSNWWYADWIDVEEYDKELEGNSF